MPDELTHYTAKEVWAMLRAADDRRYAEVNQEREKALKIKESADDRALQLASEIQKYKDEKANELRSQISEERGLYVTRSDLVSAVNEIRATIKPLEEANSAGKGMRSLIALLASAVALFLGLAAVFAFLQTDPVTVAPAASSVRIEP